MLSIKEICEKAGISLHTFKTWRRDDSTLLPPPVAVHKKVLFFDDSILERIKFIREQQAKGLKLAQINEMLGSAMGEKIPTVPKLFDWTSPYSRFKRSADEMLMGEPFESLWIKWEKGDCKDEVCKALKLDPNLSGPPITYCIIPDGLAYVSIISRSSVHFAELYLDIESYDEPIVKQIEKIPVEDYGMLLCVIGRELTELKYLLKAEMIPYLLFNGLEGTKAKRAECAYWKEAIVVASIMNKVAETGREYLIRLNDIKMPKRVTTKPQQRPTTGRKGRPPKDR